MNTLSITLDDLKSPDFLTRHPDFQMPVLLKISGSLLDRHAACSNIISLLSFDDTLTDAELAEAFDAVDSNILDILQNSDLIHTQEDQFFLTESGRDFLMQNKKEAIQIAHQDQMRFLYAINVAIGECRQYDLSTVIQETLTAYESTHLFSASYIEECIQALEAKGLICQGHILTQAGVAAVDEYYYGAASLCRSAARKTPATTHRACSEHHSHTNSIPTATDLPSMDYADLLRVQAHLQSTLLFISAEIQCRDHANKN